MLISGALPFPQATEIPVTALQLEDPTQPATQPLLLEASAVLRSYREDAENGDMPLGDSLSPVEFLEWCEEDRRARHAEKLPEFLRHIYTLKSYPRFTQTPEDEMEILRKAMAAEALRIPTTVQNRTFEALHTEPQQKLEETQVSATPGRLPDGVDSYPNSAEIASAYAGLLGKSKNQWRKMLATPPEWLKKAQISKGKRGVKPGATWNPLCIAEHLFVAGARVEIPEEKREGSRYREKRANLQRLDRLFECYFPAWTQAWGRMRNDLEDLPD